MTGHRLLLLGITILVPLASGDLGWLNENGIYEEPYNEASDNLKTQILNCSQLVTDVRSGIDYIVRSPGFPRAYQKNENCLFRLEIPANTRLMMSCPTFDIVPNEDCSSGDHLSITAHGRFNVRVCDEQLHSVSLRFPPAERDHRVLIHFFSNEDMNTAIGFDCRIRIGDAFRKAPARVATKSSLILGGPAPLGEDYTPFHIPNDVSYITENSDGARVTFFKNNTKFVERPDGVNITFQATSGKAIFHHPGGKTRKRTRTFNFKKYSSNELKVYLKNGAQLSGSPNGCTIKTAFRNGTVEEFNRKHLLRTQYFPNGTQTVFPGKIAKTFGISCKKRGKGKSDVTQMAFDEGVWYIAVDKYNNRNITVFENGNKVVRESDGTVIRFKESDKLAVYAFSDGRVQSIEETFEQHFYMHNGLEIMIKDGRNITHSPDGCQSVTKYPNGTIEIQRVGDAIKTHYYRNGTHRNISRSDSMLPFVNSNCGGSMNETASYWNYSSTVDGNDAGVLGDNVLFIVRDPIMNRTLTLYSNWTKLIEEANGTIILFASDNLAEYRFKNGTVKTVEADFKPEDFFRGATEVYHNDGRNVTFSPDYCTIATNFSNGTQEVWKLGDNFKTHIYPNGTQSRFYTGVAYDVIMERCTGSNNVTGMRDIFNRTIDSDTNIETIFFNDGSKFVRYPDGSNRTETPSLNMTLLQFPNGSRILYVENQTMHHDYGNGTILIVYNKTGISMRLLEDPYSTTITFSNGTIVTHWKMNGTSSYEYPNGTKIVNHGNTGDFNYTQAIYNVTETSEGNLTFYLDGTSSMAWRNGSFTEIMSSGNRTIHPDGTTVFTWWDSWEGWAQRTMFPNGSVEVRWKDRVEYETMEGYSVYYNNGTQSFYSFMTGELVLTYPNGTHITYDAYGNISRNVTDAKLISAEMLPNNTYVARYDNGSVVSRNDNTGETTIFHADGKQVVFRNGYEITFDNSGSNSTRFNNGTEIMQFANGMKVEREMRNGTENFSMTTVNGVKVAWQNEWYPMNFNISERGILGKCPNETMTLHVDPYGFTTQSFQNGSVSFCAFPYSNVSAIASPMRFQLTYFDTGQSKIGRRIEFPAIGLTLTMFPNGTTNFSDGSTTFYREERGLGQERRFINGTTFRKFSNGRLEWRFQNGSKIVQEGPGKPQNFIPPIAPRSVLFIGNSYTSSNGMPAMVAAFAREAGTKLNFTLIAPGAATFKTHAGASGRWLKRELARSRFNAVVLQEHSQIPSFDTDTVCKVSVPYYLQLLETIYSESIGHPEVYLYQTWGRPRGDMPNCPLLDTSCGFDAMTTKIRLSYDHYACLARPAKISPVGMAFKAYMWSYPDQDDYALFKDNGWSHHPSKAGSYLAACVHFSRLFEVSCPPWIPKGLDPKLAGRLRWAADHTLRRLGTRMNLGRDEYDERCFNRCMSEEKEDDFYGWA